MTTDPRRDPALYPFRHTVETRRSDGMQRGHVPNARIADYFDDARGAMHCDIIGPHLFDDASALSLVLAELTMRFVGEVTFPGMLTVGIGVARIGSSSLREVGAIFREGRCLVLYDCTVVKMVDRRPAPLSDAERARAERYLAGA